VKRLLAMLAMLMLLQCGLVAYTWWPRESVQAVVTVPLAAADPAAVDRLLVVDEYDNETELLRAQDRWLLPALENLPADGGRVAALLAALTAGGSGWPVADSAAARQRFQVASYHYQRRVQLYGGDRLLATVYFGTSPGFRKVHARNAAQDAIYAVPFNLVDAPGGSGGWLARDLLQLRAPTQIAADTYSLYREGDGWRAGNGLEPDPREVEALLSTLRHLEVEGVADEDLQRDLAQAEADLVLQVRDLGGDVTLELFRRGEGRFLYSSRYPLVFVVGARDFDRLAGIDADRIMGR